MADPIYGGPPAARKTSIEGSPAPSADALSPGFPPSPKGAPQSPHPGLVPHPLLSPDHQVAILAAVDESGEATLGSLMARLPGHPQPVSAVLALVDAGLLACERDVPLDANLRLWRA